MRINNKRNKDNKYLIRRLTIENNKINEINKLNNYFKNSLIVNKDLQSTNTSTTADSNEFAKNDQNLCMIQKAKSFENILIKNLDESFLTNIEIDKDDKQISTVQENINEIEKKNENDNNILISIEIVKNFEYVPKEIEKEYNEYNEYNKNTWFSIFQITKINLPDFRNWFQKIQKIVQ